MSQVKVRKIEAILDKTTCRAKTIERLLDVVKRNDAGFLEPVVGQRITTKRTGPAWVVNTGFRSCHVVATDSYAQALAGREGAILVWYNELEGNLK